MKTIFGALMLLGLGVVSLAAQQGLVASHAPDSGLAKAQVASPAPVDLSRVVTRVNGVGITERDVAEQSMQLFPYYAIHGGKVPDKYQAEIRQKAIQQLIDDELIYQAAKRHGSVIPPATMQDVMRQARRRFPTRKEYEEYAKAQYGSVENFERRIRRAVLIADYRHREIDLKAKFSDAQLRDIYAKNKKSFLRPESVWLQTITVNLPANPSAEQRELVRKRIAEIMTQVKATKSYEDFGMLAEKVSEDEYRVMMGDHKWVHLVGLPAELSQAIAPLQPGQTSGIVDSPGGLVILRVNERRPQKQMEYSEVRDQLRQQVENGARQQRAEQLRQELRKGARIESL
jgi:parvulin-like peptidyl-prolyl isomerase